MAGMEYAQRHAGEAALGGWRARLRCLAVKRDALGDNDLVTRTLAGDTRSYEELVRRYERLVAKILYPYAKREISAEDLVQETFLRAYDRLETFNPEYRFKTWLLAIANNLGIDTLRRRKEIVEFNQEVHGASSGGPETDAIDAERRAGVRVAMESLPETYQVPLMLRYDEEMSYAEIAEVLDLSVAAIKSRLFRARNMVGEILSDPDDDAAKLAGSAS